MGWETRGNNSYYYRKKRRGGKVVSEYVGTGETAQILALLDEEEKEQKSKAAESIKQERNAITALSSQMAKVDVLVRRLTDGIFLVLRYHKHKGQWRRKRNGR